ncbi:MAG: HsdR family type I site-specific deoxyribonuclease [Caulobacterales bacterium]|nr:HsdR family type I site-specific deoxyribonuclease [Caulobacterales bacterium]MCA0372177.1 HsdR family type I site-specific deoxyribonuclease [Pseudomonadota bacterium]
MANDEADIVETPALKLLQSLGWKYIEGNKLSPELLPVELRERNSFKDVILENRLAAAIKRINPWISEENQRKIIHDFTKRQFTNTFEANQTIWNEIVSYLSIAQDLGSGNKGQTVKIIDFDNIENNEFLCCNQFKVQGLTQNIIPDIVLFVNGLPLVVIECKSPYATNPLEAGIDQLRRYANIRDPSNNEGCEKLFHYNSMMVSTFGNGAAVGTISSRMEHYLEWKDPYPFVVDDENKTSQKVLITGLFSRGNFLDILQNFTIFEPVDGRIIKKIARYQQFRGVLKTIERLKSGTNRKDKSGVIWHTQGSGKSLTMVFLTVKLRRDPELRNYKLVFLTDRTQLDKQLTDTFSGAQSETIYHAKSVKDLRALLQKDSSDIITAMVQKFQESSEDGGFPLLNASDKIIVLADEAHRTQYGNLGAAINQALPNAPKIAFTGTPLIKTQKTNNEFGSYIDTYTIEQAVKDGATVQILYEGREAKLKVTGDSLDALFDEYFGDKSKEEQAAIKKKYGNAQAILEAPQRIRRVCIDILKHYREHILPNGFKAMIVTSSRNAAIVFKQMLDEEINAPESAVIISGKHNDAPKYLPFTDATKQKQQIEDFKKPYGTGKNQSNLGILIVKDMLLTGFDAPICQVMYLDRKLTDHNLLQAIARVNRTAAKKQRGFIVDYYGLSDYLTEALEMFSSDDLSGALIELKNEIPHLKAAHTRAMAHFKSLDINDTEECILLLADEQKRHDFQSDFLKFSKQMEIVLPDKAALPFVADLKILGKIAIGARNRYRDNQLNISGAGEKVKKLIEEHIYALGIDPKIAPVDLLAKDFKEKLNEHKSAKSKASEIENAIKHHISIKLDEDPEYYKSLSNRLEEIIAKAGEKWEILVQMLLEFGDDIEKKHQEAAQDLGLNQTELSFYNILMSELSKANESIDEETHQRVKDVVSELVKMMETATQIIGFFEKEDEQKEVRRNIKRTILDQPFGTIELVKAITDRFMELAKVKFK